MGCRWPSGLSGADLSRDMSVLCPCVSVKETPRGEQIPPVRCSVQRLSRQTGQPASGPCCVGLRVGVAGAGGLPVGPARALEGWGWGAAPPRAGHPDWAPEPTGHDCPGPRGQALPQPGRTLLGCGGCGRSTLCGGAAAPPAPLPGVQTPAGASRQASFVWGRWAGSGGLGREVAP